MREKLRKQFALIPSLRLFWLEIKDHKLKQYNIVLFYFTITLISYLLFPFFQKNLITHFHYVIFIVNSWYFEFTSKLKQQEKQEK